MYYKSIQANIKPLGLILLAIELALSVWSVRISNEWEVNFSFGGVQFLAHYWIPRRKFHSNWWYEHALWTND